MDTALSRLQIKQKRHSSKALESDLIPAAHSVELCTLCREDERIMNATRVLLGEKSDLDLIDKAVIEVLFLNGLRISEVLSISSNDVMSNGLIRIKGLKGSDDRYIHTQLYSHFWVNAVRKGFVLNDVRSRYYYHRLFVKKGIYYKATKEEKRIVTHVYRHLYVRMMKNDNIKLNEIKNIIGHKSINSTLHYESKKNYRA